MIEMLISGFEDVEIRDFRLLPAGDRVVALLHTHGRGERDDLEVETRDAHTITFRDGKIAYWRIYLDQAEALDGRRARSRAGRRRQPAAGGRTPPGVGSAQAPRRRCNWPLVAIVLAAGASTQAFARRRGRWPSTSRTGSGHAIRTVSRADRRAGIRQRARGTSRSRSSTTRWAFGATTPIRQSSYRRSDARLCCWPRSCGA